MEFVTTFNLVDNPDLAPHDMVDYISTNVAPEPKGSPGDNYIVNSTLAELPVKSNSTNNVLGVLDGIHTDLSRAIWSQYRIWSARQDPGIFSTYFVEWIAQIGNYCPSTDNDEFYKSPCGNMTNPKRWHRSYGTTNNYGENNTFILPFNATITNSLIGLRDAIM
jgi:hypothetical protein